DRRNLGGRFQATPGRVHQLIEADAHRGSVVGHVLRRFFTMAADFYEAGAAGLSDAVDDAPGQLRLLWKIEQTILEARRSQIGNEDFHELRSVRNPRAGSGEMRRQEIAIFDRRAAADYFLKKASSPPFSGLGMTWALTSSPTS